MSINMSSPIKKLTQNLFKQHEDKILVVIQRDPNSKLPQLEKNKLLISYNITIGSFLVFIRGRLKLPNHKSLFISTKEGDYVPTLSETMAEIYQKYHSEDKALYFYYREENAYG